MEDAEIRKGIIHILHGGGAHLPLQTIDELLEALKAAKKEKGYIWKVNIWGDLGAHWGAGFTPEEALLNAYRMYAIAWRIDPEDEPVQIPPPPEGLGWAYRPEGDHQWYNVRPPEVDLDLLSDILTDFVLPLKQSMLMFGSVNTQLVEDAYLLQSGMEDWHYDLFESDSELRGPDYCLHENAEDASANGPNLMFCDACQTMFRTDLP
jgi:hypothetical protein